MSTNNSRQAAWVALGSLFSFGFSIVSSMILSRYFDKADYGTYKQVMYVYHTLLTVFTLGLPKAFSYFIPRVAPNQAKSLIRKITRLFFFLGAVFSLFLLVLAEPISALLNNDNLKPAIRIFSPVPLLMLPTMGLEGILSSFKKNKYMTIYTIVTRLVMLICVTTPVLAFNGGYIEALYGFLISSVIAFALALYLKYLPVRGKGEVKVSVSYKEILCFSLPLMTASLWSILLHSADQFFISRYFGNEVFADFSNGSMQLPFVGMIATSCAVVLSPIISKIAHSNIDPQKELFPLWISVFEKSAKIIYPLLVYSFFFSDIIMTVLYGEKYATSGIYFSIKAIYSLFSVIIYAPLIINIGKVRYYSNVHMIAALSIVALEYLSVITIHSPYAISVISLLVEVSKSLALLWVVSHFFNVRMYQLFPIKVLGKIIIPSSFFLYLEHLFFVNHSTLNPLLCLTASFVVYAVLYMVYSHLAKLDYISIIKPILKR